MQVIQTDKNTELADQIPENYLAALDIGSNSFHFVFARLVDEKIQILHAEKYRVKLAEGLDKEGYLSKESIKRGLKTLENLTPLTQKLTAENFKIVATYTLRMAKNADEFLQAAADVFPFDIDIISGHEEARLIYQGLAYNTEPNGKRLVIDIGGGSTECIIGEDHNIYTLASLPIGCVNFQKRFFNQEKISKDAFSHAIQAASYEVESIIKRFNKIGWETSIGTSGTIKSLYNVLNHGQELAQPITLKQLNSLKEKLISMKNFQDINLPALKENRTDVICSGLAILIALFEMLNIKQLNFCNSALREGVLNEQLDLIHCDDVRVRSVNSLCTRFSIDHEQSENVWLFAQRLYEKVQQSWKLNSGIYQNLLRWSAQLYEVGADINASGYHKHGEYIIKYADIAGFSKEQQNALAWLVGSHRKKLIFPKELKLNILKRERLIKTCALLRLSVLLCQQRQLSEAAEIKIKATDSKITLTIKKAWLNERPMIVRALSNEQQLIEEAGIQLIIITE